MRVGEVLNLRLRDLQGQKLILETALTFVLEIQFSLYHGNLLAGPLSSNPHLMERTWCSVTSSFLRSQLSLFSKFWKKSNSFSLSLISIVHHQVNRRRDTAKFSKTASAVNPLNSHFKYGLMANLRVDIGICIGTRIDFGFKGFGYLLLGQICF